MQSNILAIDAARSEARTEQIAFDPIRVLEVELSQALPSLTPYNPANGQVYRRAMVLVRLHTQPLGVVDLVLGELGLTPAKYAHHIWSALNQEINKHLRHDDLPEITELDEDGIRPLSSSRCIQERTTFLATAPFASVIVATRDRPESLAACLRSLLSLDYPNFEIIVVDNAPRTGATSDFIQQTYCNVDQVRYVREERPGLSWARNRGLSEAHGEIVAITDDDVLVDKHWLTELVRGFSVAENVACVTGNILPAEIETPAQLLLEQFGGFSKGFTRQIFDLSEHRSQHPLYPYNAGTFGSGANLAFKTSILREFNGFDCALGAGTLALGGEDLAICFQVITEGYQLVYQPGALLRHFHRRDYASLRKQMYNYGVGLTAFLTKCLLDDPFRIPDIVRKVPKGLYFVFSPNSPKNQKKREGYPQELTRLELKGMLYGPLSYLRSWWKLTQIKN
jgi:GT2 family glycosyltransferase